MFSCVWCRGTRHRARSQLPEADGRFSGGTRHGRAEPEKQRPEPASRVCRGALRGDAQGARHRTQVEPRDNRPASRPRALLLASEQTSAGGGEPKQAGGIAVAVRIGDVPQWQAWTNKTLAMPLKTTVHACPQASALVVGQLPLDCRSSAPLQLQSKLPQASLVVK